MDDTVLLALIAAAAIGLLAVLAILRRDRQKREANEADTYAPSTEGETRCPKCGMGNLWTDTTCIGCGARLRS